MASRNIFACLDSDDEDTPKVQTPAPAAAPKPVKTVKAGKEGEQTSKKQDGGRNGGRGGRGEGRGGRGEGRGGRGEGRGPRPDGQSRAPRAPRADRPEGSTGTNLRNERERGERPDRSHHHRSNEGGERQPREAREGGERREGKRQFDRKSGTGRGKEVSKSGGGARNWGNEDDKTEQAAEAAVGDEVADEVKAEETEVAEPVVVEEEDNTITYEEFMAKKKATRSNEELFGEKELRTVDTSEFASASLLSKDGKTPDFIESAFDKIFTKKTSGRKKNVLDANFSIASTSSAPREDRDGGRGGRGGRGARGEGRGGRGEGRGQGPKKSGSKANAPNVADLNAFPSL